MPLIKLPKMKMFLQYLSIVLTEFNFEERAMTSLCDDDSIMILSSKYTIQYSI